MAGRRYPLSRPVPVPLANPLRIESRALGRSAEAPAFQAGKAGSTPAGHTRGSANGRLPVFEAGDEGSNPSPRNRANASRDASVHKWEMTNVEIRMSRERQKSKTERNHALRCFIFGFRVLNFLRHLNFAVCPFSAFSSGTVAAGMQHLALNQEAVGSIPTPGTEMANHHI